MFDDAIRSKGLSEEIQVLDIAEILERELFEQTCDLSRETVEEPARLKPSPN